MRALRTRRLLPILLGAIVLGVLTITTHWVIVTAGYTSILIGLSPSGVMEIRSAPAGATVLAGDTLLDVGGLRPNSGSREDLYRFDRDLTNHYRPGDVSRWALRRNGDTVTADVVFENYPRVEFLSHVILFSSFWILIGFLLWLRPDVLTIRLLAYTVLAFSVGQLLRLGLRDGSTPFGIVAGQVEALSKYFAPALAVHFATTFPLVTLSTRARRRVLALAYGIPFPFYLIEVWLHIRAADRAVRYPLLPEWLTRLHYWDFRYWIVVGALVTAGVLMLRTHHRLASAAEKAQIRWVVWAVVTAATLDACYMAVAMYLPGLPVRQDQPLRMVIYFLIPAGLAISILRYDLYDINVVIRKTSIFGLMSTILVLLFAAAQFGAATIAGRINPDQDVMSVSIAAAVTAGAMGPLYARLRVLCDRFFLEHLPPAPLAEYPQSESTVMFIDISGFTSLAATDEPASILLLSCFHRSVGRACRPVGGRVVKTLGDGVLLEFPRPDAALAGVNAFVTEFQATTKESHLPSASLHCGAHSGIVVRGRDGDLFGDTVNVAHRLQAAASPGELIVSSETAAFLSSTWQFKLAEVEGPQPKHLPRPIRVFSYPLG